jgi:hypothetical protein
MLSGNEEKDKLKLATWYAKLKEFSFEDCQKAVFKLLDNKIYGKPNISDLMEILNNDGTDEIKAIIENAKDSLLNGGTDSAWEYLKKYDLQNFFGYWELRNMNLNRVDSVFKHVENTILKDKQHVQLLVEKREQYRLEYEKQQQLLESSE